VAIEATANWYWIIDEIEQARCVPRLVHPRKAKLMMGQINKTDKLDTHGMNVLQRNGTLPTVWIPPGPLRELRELTRTRVVLVAQRTRWKNRITATLAKWGLPASEYSDPYGKSAREELGKRLEGLPEQTRWATQQMLTQLDALSEQIQQFEKRLEELVEVTPEMQRLETLPGVGVILAATIALEIGEIGRFASAERLASYSGTTPRVHSSGDRTRYGRTRPDVNRYLKWAFAEAANSVAVNYRRCPERHVSQLYARLRARKGHAKAVGAVARHLAEATFHVLSRQQAYRDPTVATGRTSEV
jgi:transposase